MDRGYIKLFRKIQQNDFWSEKPFHPALAWIDLILMVNANPAKIQFNGENITIRRGQKLTSYTQLADRWGWSRKRVANQFKKWDIEVQIIGKGREKAVLLTLTNYNNYRQSGTTKEQQRYQQKPLKNKELQGEWHDNGTTKEHKQYKEKDYSISDEGRKMNDWQIDVACVNKRLKEIDKMQNGDPAFCAMLIKRHGFVLTVAKIEQIADNAGTFRDEKHAKAYIIASMKKASVGSGAYSAEGHSNYDISTILPSIQDLLNEQGQ